MDDQESFTWFFTAEYPQVVRLLTVVLHERAAAEDVAQDAFVRLHRHWSRISRYERPDAWIRRVALNCALSWRHRERVRRERESRAALMDASDRSSATPAPVEVWQAVRTLPARDRALIGLYYLEDRPLAEVADILDLKENAAKVALHRARQRLADRLRDQEQVTHD